MLIFLINLCTSASNSALKLYCRHHFIVQDKYSGGPFQQNFRPYRYPFEDDCTKYGFISRSWFWIGIITTWAQIHREGECTIFLSALQKELCLQKVDLDFWCNLKEISDLTSYPLKHSVSVLLGKFSIHSREPDSKLNSAPKVCEYHLSSEICARNKWGLLVFCWFISFFAPKWMPTALQNSERNRLPVQKVWINRGHPTNSDYFHPIVEDNVIFFPIATGERWIYHPDHTFGFTSLQPVVTSIKFHILFFGSNWETKNFELTYEDKISSKCSHRSWVWN